ncbi:MAG TPA: biopolymer transporter ExbD [Rhodanobacteraceae bacterium]|nr:biopolymer transporter ExbD [Rhodanobacteraceae bacterium]
MRLSAKRQNDDFEINVISLIDVLLTLLMFFVLTTTFVQQSRLKVTLPESSEAAKPAEADTLVLLIDREGHYYIGNNEVLDPGVDGLKKALATLAGADRQRPVLLRADGMTPNQAVVTAMDALGQLGFVNLRIATTPSPQAGQ